MIRKIIFFIALIVSNQTWSNQDIKLNKFTFYANIQNKAQESNESNYLNIIFKDSKNIIRLHEIINENNKFEKFERYMNDEHLSKKEFEELFK